MRRVIHEGAFNGATQKGDLDEALRQARDMAGFEPLTSQDALKLLLLMARLGNYRFDKAAQRWEEMFKAEGHPEIEQRIAEAAIEGVGRDATRPRCETILWDLVCSVES